MRFPAVFLGPTDCSEVGPDGRSDQTFTLLILATLVRVFVFPLEIDIEEEFEACVLCELHKELPPSCVALILVQLTEEAHLRVFDKHWHLSDLSLDKVPEILVGNRLEKIDFV